MPLTRRQFLDNLARSRPAFHNIAKGSLVNETHNVFDHAFTVHNDGGELERVDATSPDGMLLTPIPDGVFDFSQYMSDTAPTTGMGSDVAPTLSPAKTVDISTPGLSSFFDAITPNPLQSHTGNTPFQTVGSDAETFGDYANFPNLHVDYFSQFDEQPGDFEKQQSYEAKAPLAATRGVSPLSAADHGDRIDTDAMQYTFIETSPADEENRNHSKPPRMRYPDIASPTAQDDPQAGRTEPASDAVASTKGPPRSGTRRKKRPLSEADQQVKRDRFLYKNKVAAQKCRERKKSRTVELQDRFREVQHEQRTLELELLQLSEEAAWLRSQVSLHLECGFDGRQGKAAPGKEDDAVEATGPGLSHDLSIDDSLSEGKAAKGPEVVGAVEANQAATAEDVLEVNTEVQDSKTGQASDTIRVSS